MADALARIAAQPELNAVITACEEEALARARARRAAARWPACRCSSRTSSTPRACGRPTARRSTPTTCPSARAPAVTALEAQGAIVVGKANLDEFAWGVCGQNTFYGDTVNPAAPDRVAGGSSSGNAAALAAGHGPAGARHRHGRLGPHPGRGVRRGRAQDGDRRGADRGRLPAGGELRHGRPDGAHGRRLRAGACGADRDRGPGAGDRGAARRRADGLSGPRAARGAGRARRARAGPRRAPARHGRRRHRAFATGAEEPTRGPSSTPTPPWRTRPPSRAGATSTGR